jgi:hypothetical protein
VLLTIRAEFESRPAHHISLLESTDKWHSTALSL